MSNLLPGVGVCVFILKDNKVLLGYRLNNSNFGHQTYSLPGGKVDWNKDPINAAIRETKEETSLDVKDLEFVGYLNNVFPECNKHYITLFFMAHKFSGIPTVMEPSKCAHWTWYDIDNLPTPLFCQWKNVLADYLLKNMSASSVEMKNPA
jgi:8-oxo-dGTP diphosphatase